MISTTTAIAFIILVLSAAAVLVIFVPVVFASKFSFSDARLNCILNMQWMHPCILNVTYNLETRRTELNILGLKRALTGVSGFRDKHSVVKMNGNEDKPINTSLHGETRATDPEKLGTKNNYEGTSLRAELPSETRDNGPLADKKYSTWKRIKKTIGILIDSNVIAKMFRWCWRTLPLCFHVVQFDHFLLHAKAGVGDPAETGKIYGWYSALRNVLLMRQRNIDVQFEPYFSGEALEIEGNIGLKTSIIRIGIPLTVALMTFPYLSVFTIWRRIKKGTT